MPERVKSSRAARFRIGVTVSVVTGDDIAGDDPDQDADLYQNWKAQPRYLETG